MAINLLLVEKDSEQVELISKFLRNSDYTYKWAPDVERAKALLAARFFSVVLSDLNVEEGGDGFELMRWIRKKDGINNIPIVLMTGAASADVVIKARSIGVQGFLIKPFQPRALMKVLAQCVTTSQRRVGTKTRIADTDKLQARIQEAETQAQRGQG